MTNNFEQSKFGKNGQCLHPVSKGLTNIFQKALTESLSSVDKLSVLVGKFFITL